MAEQSIASIEGHFWDLQDPRIDRTKRHKLLDIGVIAICASACGADGWVSIEEFGKAKLRWFRGFLELPNGIPSHDTFGRVFGSLDPDQFRTCFMNWVMAVSEITEGAGDRHRRQDLVPFARQETGQRGDSNGQCIGRGRPLGSRSGQSR